MTEEVNDTGCFPEVFNDTYLYKQEQRLREKVNRELDVDVLCYKHEPESMLIEEERAAYTKLFCKLFWEELSKPEHSIRKKYLVTYLNTKDSKGNYSFNITEVADKYNVSRLVVYRNIEYCRNIAKAIMNYMGIESDNLQYFFRPQVNLFHTQSASHVGTPMEQYMLLPAKRTWQTKIGSKRATTKAGATCLMPDYLLACDCVCTCSICCEDCRRKDIYPENKLSKEFLSKNMKKLKECVKNIKEEMKTMDLSKLERKSKL